MATTNNEAGTYALTLKDIHKVFGSNQFSQISSFRLEVRKFDDNGTGFMLTGINYDGRRLDIIRVRSKKKLSQLTGVIS